MSLGQNGNKICHFSSKMGIGLVEIGEVGVEMYP